MVRVKLRNCVNNSFLVGPPTRATAVMKSGELNVTSTRWRHKVFGRTVNRIATVIPTEVQVAVPGRSTGIIAELFDSWLGPVVELERTEIVIDKHLGGSDSYFRHDNFPGPIGNLIARKSADVLLVKTSHVNDVYAAKEIVRDRIAHRTWVFCSFDVALLAHVEDLVDISENATVLLDDLGAQAVTSTYSVPVACEKLVNWGIPNVIVYGEDGVSVSDNGTVRHFRGSLTWERLEDVAVGIAKGAKLLAAATEAARGIIRRPPPMGGSGPLWPSTVL